ncbi:hypothetical protein DAT1711_12100 [Enterococcus cecorum]
MISKYYIYNNISITNKKSKIENNTNIIFDEYNKIIPIFYCIVTAESNAKLMSNKQDNP